VSDQLPEPLTLINKPAVLHHVFLAADQVAEPDGPARPCLELLWDAVHELGLTEPLPDLPASLELTRITDGSAGFGAERVSIIGARQHPGAGIQQAIAYLRHDVVGVMVMLAPEDPELTWHALEARWAGATQGISWDAALGTADIHLALLPSDETDPYQATELAGQLRDLVPAPNTGPWPPCWSAIADQDITIWELPWQDQQAVTRRRRLLVLAPCDREPDLDAWAWAREAPGLVPLTSYLLNAAKIRYAYSIQVRDLPALRRLITDTENASSELLTYVTAFGSSRWIPGQSDGAAASLNDVRQAGQRLSQLSTMTNGLTRSEGKLATLQQMVAFAAVNAHGVIDPGFRSQPGSPFAIDEQLARALETQLSAEAGSLRAVSTRAAEVVKLSDTTIDSYLRDRQAELTLAQTSVIGGLLMVLGAMQAFNYRVHLPHSLHAPLIAVLGSLALALPVVIPRWRLLDMGRAAQPATLADVGIALVGASAGWLVTSLVAVTALNTVALARWSVTFALVGAALGVAVDLLWVRRRKSAPA
jgi:hypothetical protein